MHLREYTENPSARDLLQWTDDVAALTYETTNETVLWMGPDVRLCEWSHGRTPPAVGEFALSVYEFNGRPSAKRVAVNWEGRPATFHLYADVESRILKHNTLVTIHTATS